LRNLDCGWSPSLVDGRRRRTSCRRSGRSIPPLAAAGSSTGKTTEKLTIERTWIVVVPKQPAPRPVQRDAKK